MSRRPLRAVAVTEPGAVATQVLPQKDDTLLWAKCKYALCLACYPNPTSRDGIAMFMRQRFFNPEKCEESDLHPLVFPPPFSQIVVYGPALFVSMKNDTVGPLALPTWKAAWQQMHTHSWETAGQPPDASAGDKEEDEEEDEEDEEDEEEDEGVTEETDTDSDHSSVDNTSYEDRDVDDDDGNTTETDSDAPEEEGDVQGGSDMYIPDDFAPPIVVEPRKRQRRYMTRSTLLLGKGPAST